MSVFAYSHHVKYILVLDKYYDFRQLNRTISRYCTTRFYIYQYVTSLGLLYHHYVNVLECRMSHKLQNEHNDLGKFDVNKKNTYLQQHQGLLGQALRWCMGVLFISYLGESYSYSRQGVKRMKLKNLILGNRKDHLVVCEGVIQEVTS